MLSARADGTRRPHRLASFRSPARCSFQRRDTRREKIRGLEQTQLLQLCAGAKRARAPPTEKQEDGFVCVCSVRLRENTSCPPDQLTTS